MPETTVEEIKSKVAAGELRMPTWREVANKMRTVAVEKGEWAGLPVPVNKDYPLAIEPRYPYRLDQFYTPPVRVCHVGAVDETAEGWTGVNSWHCQKYGATVVVQRHTHTHRSRAAYIPQGWGKKVARLIGCLAVEPAWLPTAETKAMTKLWNLVGNHKFTQYTLTGTFMESSSRSGVTYLFRRLAPTIAMRPGPDNDMRVLCTLCLHPIGYYQDTSGGVMVPTDDVIAHLVFMRGDEPKFWANANQHAPADPLSGI